jgi:DNA-binding NarL/FixJ family response regulator
MDATMPGMGGIDAMIAIKKREPGIRVIILTIHKTEEQIRHALQAGADGYMIKTDSSAELKTCIDSVVTGNRYLSPAVSNQLVNVLLNENRSGNTDGEPQTLDSLSKREREVLKLAAEGYKNQAIAEYLAINIKTVEKHKTSMRRKLQLFTSSELTNFAIEHGLIDS